MPEKNRNIGAQLQSILYTTAKKIGKFTSCMTFGAHKVVHSKPFLDYLYEIWQLLSALYSDVRKIFYIYILGPKLLQWNFLQISQLPIRSRAHKLFRSFLDFSKFLNAILQKLYHQLGTKIRTILRFWMRNHFWKRRKQNQNRPINGGKIAVQSIYKLSWCWQRARHV